MDHGWGWVAQPLAAHATGGCPPVSSGAMCGVLAALLVAGSSVENEEDCRETKQVTRSLIFCTIDLP